MQTTYRIRNVIWRTRRKVRHLTLRTYPVLHTPASHLTYSLHLPRMAHEQKKLKHKHRHASTLRPYSKAAVTRCNKAFASSVPRGLLCFENRDEIAPTFAPLNLSYFASLRHRGRISIVPASQACIRSKYGL